MYKLIVYGSLINQEELQNQGLWGHNTELVKVFGYQRVFNQEPSYRLLSCNQRAVLSIQAQASSWFNALMIKDLDEAFFEALDLREIGYERIKVDCKSYGGDFYKDCFVYMGRSNKHSQSIEPNTEYLNICLQGAKSWGKEFHQDFIETTFKNSNSKEEAIVPILKY